ncbi:hypothetical protein PSENEW3n2_00000814 [Picochlorum sp. SENEW3]|nr:hypothetical protein PSENEW3n2_00000814 [Picochlorum sp. SENEW3]WPT15735.1 hypothetical protein PSENEW3_00000814 [Picochlorum sp. SENEW3]
MAQQRLDECTKTREIEAHMHHALYCFDVLAKHLRCEEHVCPVVSEQLQRAVGEYACPLFVTWNKQEDGYHDGEVTLRGCIGTFAPQDITKGLEEYAIISALRDSRFPPISQAELSALSCTVSLLHSFEQGSSWDDWEVGTHGVSISFRHPKTRSRHSATFLPDVAADHGWDHRTTMKYLISKSGCHMGDDMRELERILSILRLERYQSSTCHVSYQDYVLFYSRNRHV